MPEMTETNAPAGQKLSSADLLRRLEELTGAIRAQDRLLELELNPAPLVIYKPQGDTSKGAALQVDLRLTPTYSPEGFLKEVDGGLYFDLVSQGPNGTDGFARFNWKGDDKVTAKLGLPDITGMLTALRNKRITGLPVPTYLQPNPKFSKAKDPANTFEALHKFDGGSTVISWAFQDEGSFLRVSKSKDLWRVIRLSLSEERAVETYLEQALRGFLRVGLR